MTSRHFVVAAVAASMLALFPASAQAAGLERLTILDCGRNVVKDQSQWSPGHNVGKAKVFSNNCYLIQHEKGLLLWETGVPDAIAMRPDGVIVAGGRITLYRAKTLAAQLAALKATPDRITYVGTSHTHGDHVGNLKAFATSKILMQRAEYDFAAKSKSPPFTKAQTIVKLSGDHDVFGDASVVIFSTPGHTPGHQSLLVKLPKTGAVILSGDAVHFRWNWDNKGVPAGNFDKAQTLASMERIRGFMAKHKARLWINHDQPQTATLKRAPGYYE
ncbi:MAG TPA: N-acyl homoserine lactonase family protein [Alphaproteobacteria bacterium]|nr:N-acyl homoserine lactonase family protein [Alphaproteobacteria bacterium]